MNVQVFKMDAHVFTEASDVFGEFANFLSNEFVVFYDKMEWFRWMRKFS